MSWASLANNQTVSFNNLQDAVNNGVFISASAIPSSNKCLKCEDATTYVLVESVSGGNKLVRKEQLIGAATFYPVYDCYHTEADTGYMVACGVTGSETYYNTTGGSGWSYGDKIWKYNGDGTYSTLTAVGVSQAYVSFMDGGVHKWLRYYTSNGIVFDVGTCPTPAYLTLFLSVTEAGGDIYLNVYTQDEFGVSQAVTSYIYMDLYFYDGIGNVYSRSFTMLTGTSVVNMEYMFNGISAGFPNPSLVFVEVAYYDPISDANWEYIIEW